MPGRRQVVDAKARTRQMHATAVRRARGARLPYSLEELRAAYAAAPRFCPYCKAMLYEGNVSLDHRVPLGRGGSHGLENVEFVCSGCNKAKGDLSHEEFALLISALDEVAQKCRNVGLKSKVLGSMRTANSFRIGANRRAKKSV